MGTSSDNFCLRWNDFESNITSAFQDLRSEEDFLDVTLVTADEKQIGAHKVILSACSSFFRKVLKTNPHQNPLLYLKGIHSRELIGVLNFMYHGSVNISQEELNAFLSVAEDLNVKGLTTSDTASPPSSAPAPTHKKSKAKRTSSSFPSSSSAPAPKKNKSSSDALVDSLGPSVKMETHDDPIGEEGEDYHQEDEYLDGGGGGGGEQEEDPSFENYPGEEDGAGDGTLDHSGKGKFESFSVRFNSEVERQNTLALDYYFLQALYKLISTFSHEDEILSRLSCCFFPNRSAPLCLQHTTPTPHL